MTALDGRSIWTDHPGGPLPYQVDGRFGADGLPPGAWFGRVSAVVEAPDGTIVVFHRGPAIAPVVVLDREGRHLRSWDAGFGLPHGMRLAPDGHLWLTDAARHRVVKATLAGEILVELGTPDVAGTDERTFNKPTDVAIAADGTIYVSDGYGNRRVVRFDPDGNYLGSWGRAGTAPGEFDTPHSVAVAPDGIVWISDRENHRIQRFEPDGRYVDSWTHLGATQCIEFFGAELWVVTHRNIREVLSYDSLAGRLMRVDPNDGSVLGSMPLPGHWVHRSPSGELWVAGLNGTVIRLRSGGQADAAEEDPGPVRLRLGAQILTYGSTWDEALDTVRLLEELGYDYVWGHDHLYSTGGDPYQAFFEGWTTLAAWAQATSRIRLGLTVAANTFRNPGVVAKMAVTIDHISHGRSILGLGAGNMEFENRAHGIDPGKTLGERFDWFEESLAIVTGLIGGQQVTHHSAKYQFDHVRHNPQPVQAHIPLIIGADGERRGLKLAARHADIWQWFAPFDGVALFRHKDEVLRGHAAAEARDEASIERTLGAKLILRSDPAEARRVAEELVAIHKWGPSVWDAVWATTPERAADRLSEFIDAGADSFSPQIGWPYDRETIERLVGEVKPAVEARAGA